MHFNPSKCGKLQPQLSDELELVDFLIRKITRYALRKNQIGARVCIGLDSPQRGGKAENVT